MDSENVFVIQSHEIYKMEHRDVGELKLKAYIVTRGSEKDMHNFLVSGCIESPSSFTKRISSIASRLVWTVYNADTKIAYLQTGND